MFLLIWFSIVGGKNSELRKGIDICSYLASTGPRKLYTTNPACVVFAFGGVLLEGIGIVPRLALGVHYTSPLQEIKKKKKKKKGHRAGSKWLLSAMRLQRQSTVEMTWDWKRRRGLGFRVNTSPRMTSRLIPLTT